jgi:transposase
VTRRQLTDEQWTFIEPYLPIGEYGPYPERLRDQFEGVIWRFRSGAQALVSTLITGWVSLRKAVVVAFRWANWAGRHGHRGPWRP